MKIRSKKGTTMVEAAMIFPLVITAVVAVLYIVIGMYQSLALQSSIHIALRKECGELSQTVYRTEKITSYPADKERLGIRPILRMEQEKEYQINAPFKDKVIRKEEGRYYLLDEPELIRILSIQGEE